MGYNDHLRSFAGLESLSHVLFSVSIQSNQNLYNLTGLDSLQSIGYESDYNVTVNRLLPKKSAQEDAGGKWFGEGRLGGDSGRGEKM